MPRIGVHLVPLMVAAVAFGHADAQTRVASVPTMVPSDFIDLNGLLFFSGFDAGRNYEPWISSGTVAGTKVVKEIHPGPSWSMGVVDPYTTISFGNVEAVRAGNDILFMAYDAPQRQGLFKSDGTAAGTTKLRDFGTVTYGFPLTGFAAGGHVYLMLRGQLWRTDPGRTRIDLIGSSFLPMRFHPYGRQYLFVSAGPSIRDLWRGDGTTAGTIRLMQLPAEWNSLTYVDFRGAVYVLGQPKSGSSTAIYATRGTVATTQRVVPVELRPIKSLLRVLPQHPWMAATSTHLYYPNYTSTGVDLMQSDGTAAGTRVLVRDLTSRFELVTHFVAVADNVYFVVSRSIGESQLWVTDGTAAGTRQLIASRGVGETVDKLTPFGSRRLVFSHSAGNSQHNAWITDGSIPGTRLLSAVHPNPLLGSAPRQFVSSGGRLFFPAEDGTSAILPFSAHGGLYAMELGATTQQLGEGCTETGLASTLTASDPVLGASMVLEIYDAPAQSSGLVLVGGQTVGRITSLGSGCELFFDAATAMPLVIGTDTAGRWSTTLSVPNDPSIIGARLVAQAGIGRSRQPLGVDLSSAVLMVPGR